MGGFSPSMGAGTALRPILVVLITLAIALPASGAEYFIATSGSDTSGDGSLARPWRTFPKCLGAMTGGDTCSARGGTYDTGASSWLYTGIGGTSGAPKLLRSYPGETAIIRGTSTTSPPGTYVAMHFNAMDYVTFRDLVIYGNVRFDDGESDGIVFTRNTFHCPGFLMYNGSPTGNQSHIYVQRPQCGTRACDQTGWQITENRFVVDADCPQTGSEYYDWIHLYRTSGAVIQNNDFINNHATIKSYRGVYIKSDNTDAVVRFNYFAGNGSNIVFAVGYDYSGIRVWKETTGSTKTSS